MTAPQRKRRSKITQLERDLHRFTTQKVYTLMRDVVQSFEIADLPRGHAASCLGAVFMRISTTIAVNQNMSKAAFMRYCDQFYAAAMKEHRNNP